MKSLNEMLEQYGDSGELLSERLLKMFTAIVVGFVIVMAVFHAVH